MQQNTLGSGNLKLRVTSDSYLFSLSLCSSDGYASVSRTALYASTHTIQLVTLCLSGPTLLEEGKHGRILEHTILLLIQSKFKIVDKHLS